MNSITITTASGRTATIKGCEYDYALMLTTDIGTGVLPAPESGATNEDWLWALVPSGKQALRRDMSFRHYMSSLFRPGEVTFNGEVHEGIDLCANTAMVAGSQPIALLARIAVLVGTGLYVLPEDQPWLAGVIRTGLETELLHPDTGWENFADLLDEAHETIILGSSWADEDDEPFGDILARIEPNWWMRLDPGSINKPALRDGCTFFDLLASDEYLHAGQAAKTSVP